MVVWSTPSGAQTCSQDPWLGSERRQQVPPSLTALGPHSRASDASPAKWRHSSTISLESLTPDSRISRVFYSRVP